MPRFVVVRAPTRLHFGLFALASASGRQFGGVGAMVQEPGLRLRVEPSPQWQVAGPLAGRVDAAADRWRRFHQLPARPDCRVIVEQVPPEHVGLGVGTQLALSVGAGLSAFCGLPASSPQELALSVGRGERSAIGTYGFALGGLIVEQGKLRGEPVSPLDTRLDLPQSWRFLLVRPLAARGLSGELERAAMDCTTATTGTTQELICEVREHLVPAAATADFESFSHSLYRYCRLAGSFYIEQQRGPYNGPVLSSLVERIRSWGHAGVGQSSWGPTLFVALRDADAAQDLESRLRREWDRAPLEIVVARPNNTGAKIDIAESASAAQNFPRS